MKLTVAFAITILGAFNSAYAADIFLRPARGSGLTRSDRIEVTALVARAVRAMPEHTLVTREDEADFALLPTIVVRNDQRLLRIEKIRHGETLAMSEEPIESIHASRDRAMAVTKTALQDDEGSVSGMTSSRDRDDANRAEVVSSSPISKGRPDSEFFQLGVGPAFASGMKTDSVMTDILATYNVRYDDNIVLKAIADLALGSGTDSARFLNFGIGADYYPPQNIVTFGQAYFGVDAGFAFTRDNDDTSENGIAVGAGTGVKFAASQLNMDVNLHYSLLTTRIESSYPSIFGVRLAVNF